MRVPMNRKCQHILPTVEDVLLSVAVMVVNIQYSDLSELTEMMGGNSGIVEVAKAAKEATLCVVAGGGEPMRKLFVFQKEAHAHR